MGMQCGAAALVLGPYARLLQEIMIARTRDVRIGESAY